MSDAGAKKTLSRVQRLVCLGIMGAICTNPTGAMKALTGLPPLDLVTQREARSAALESGMLVLPSHQLRTQWRIDVASELRSHI
jgi:hypothetical protein